MKNIKQYKRIKNNIPQYELGKPSGFGMPGRRVLGYEPGEQGDQSGWSNFAGTDLSPAISAGRKAATQANLSGVVNGVSAITPYAQNYFKSTNDAALSAGASVGASTAASALQFAPGTMPTYLLPSAVNSTVAQSSAALSQIASEGVQGASTLGSTGATGLSSGTSSAGSSAGSTAGSSAGTIAGSAIGGAVALYNGIGLLNALSDIPTVDPETMKSTQSHGTAMVNGIRYNRLGNINVSQVEDMQDVMDAQWNAQARSSEIGMGAGLGGAIGSIGGPVGGLIGSGIGALVGGITSLFTGVDQTEEARYVAQQLNKATANVNEQERDKAASLGARRNFYTMNAKFGKVSTPRLRRCNNGKTSIVKQFNSNGMLLPLNRNYGSNIS